MAPQKIDDHIISTKKKSHTHNGERNQEIVTSIPSVLVTVNRQPFTQAKNTLIDQAGTPRANIAPSTSHPSGTTKNDWAAKHADQTVLQQHCEFFDPDKDGIIWPLDTFHSFRKLGFGYFLSLLSMVIIHSSFAYPTQTSWIPDPRCPIYLRNIHKDKHGSDTGTYDHEGRFIPQHFEDIFAKYAGGRDYVTAGDLFNVWNCRHMVADPFGWGGGMFEWFATYVLIWPEDGRISKEDMRGIYDGSGFYEIAEKRALAKKHSR